MADIPTPSETPAPAMSPENSAVRKPRHWPRTLLTLALLAVFGGAAGYFGRVAVDLLGPTPPVIQPIENAPVEVAAADEQPAPLAEPEGQVLAEEDVVLPGMLRSENFRLGEVAIGGEIGLRADADQFVPLGITFVRGEAVPDKNKKDARVLITWKTTKAAISTLRYGKSGATPSQTYEEEGYGVNHSAVISGLEQATTYTYLIQSRDRWGNTVQSDTYAVYTGARTISLFELISGALGDIFGWAFNR